MTLKEELAEAQTKITDLEGKVQAAKGLQTKLDESTENVKAAEKARDGEKARADKAETSLKAVEGERDAEKTRATDLDGKLTAAKQEAADAKASEQKMTEQLAARGIKPVRKANAASENNGKGDQVTAEELREQLSACTDPAEKFKLSQQIRKLETPAK